MAATMSSPSRPTAGTGEVPALTYPLVQAAEIGEMLGGVPKKTILQYAREGRLPSVNIGTRVHFCRAQVAAWVDRAAARGEAI